jgi:hypothetical protein
MVPSRLPVMGAAIVFALTAVGTLAQDLDAAKRLDVCRTIQDSAARLRCFEDAASSLSGNRPAAPSGNRLAAPSGSMEGWRLVRTPNPLGGKDAVSVMHTADPLRSDQDLAGLIVRCADTGTEVLIALISPFPPRAHPRVVFDGSTLQLQASVVPPGASILLPAEATALANGPWQSLDELSLQIDQEGTIIRGVIPIRGLPAALQSLRANCFTK